MTTWMDNVPLDWLWLVGLLAAVVFFAVVEGIAFRYPERESTLSSWVAWIGAKWPLSIWLCGIFSGVLATHFWSRWCM